MIKLNSDTFRRAIEKARTLAPACELKFANENNFTFQVQSASSKGGSYTVDVWFQGGTLWTSCDCAAGSGLYRRGFPQPCYHVAAAAMSVGLFTQAMPLGAVLDPAPEGAAAPQAPAPLVDTTAPVPFPGVGALRKAARWLGRVFWIIRKEARA